ncbi:MAG TPA: tripartite tricarboxylate transporter substrate binding protein [Burkholderiaceae bacterium]|nr:tripartite tricarboxylate transporter substrate binding protein [Burkholderiaceae bacterium]
MSARNAERDRRRRTLTMLAAATLSGSGLAGAQTAASPAPFPTRPLRLVVPFTAGGNVDLVARIVAQALGEQLGQNVVVENRPGANAIIGAEFVARAAPDGYTMLVGTAETHAINPHIYAKLPYDPLQDLVSVGVIDRFPFSLVVHPGLPVRDLGEFVAHAKRNRDRINYASWGVGSTSQIAFEQIKQTGGFDAVHVPFQGAAPAITAVAAGDVQAFVVPLSVAVPHANAGRVKLLAVTSAQREQSAPSVPTATEQGLPVVIGGWHVLTVPRATPADVVERLNQALARATSVPAVRDSLLKQGVEPLTMSSAQTRDMVRAEWQRWGQVAQAAGVRASQ